MRGENAAVHCEMGDSERRLSSPEPGGGAMKRAGTRRLVLASEGRQSAGVSGGDTGAERETRGVMGSALGEGNGRMPPAQAAPR